MMWNEIKFQTLNVDHSRCKMACDVSGSVSSDRSKVSKM